MEVGYAIEAERARRALAAGRSVLLLGPKGSDVHGLGSSVAETTRIGGLQLRDGGLESLSPSRVAALAEALRGQPAVVSAHRRRAAAWPRAFDALLEAGQLEMIELSPVSPAVLHRVVETTLGAELDASILEMLVPTRAADDLELLRSAATDAREAGAVVLDPQRNRWVGGASWHPTGLRSVLLQRMPPTEPPTRGELAVDLLGLVPSVGLEAALEIARILGEPDLDQALESFEEEGVVIVSGGARGHALRLADGVHELVAAASVGEVGRGRIGAAVHTVLSRIPPEEMSPAELIAWTCAALDRHRPLSSDALLLAARAAVRDASPATALRISRAAVDVDGGLDAQMVLAAAEMRSGAMDTAEERLVRIRGEAQTDRQRADVTATLARLAATRPRAARLLSDDIDDAEKSRRGARGDLSAADDPALIRAHDAYVLFALGDPVGAAALLETVLDTLSGDQKASALYIYASGAFLAGRLASAEQALDEADAILVRPSQETFASQLLRCVIHQFTGEISHSLHTARSSSRAVRLLGSADSLAMTEWATASLALASGAAPEAVGMLEPIVETMEENGMQLTARTVRADLAEALVLCGRLAEAEEALQPVLLSMTDSERPPGQNHRALQVHAWVLAGRGHLREAQRTAIRSANVAAALGSHLAEMVALSEAARFGAANEVVARVESLGAIVDGAYAALATHHTRVLASLEALDEGAIGTDGPAVAADLADTAAHAAECERFAIAAEALARASRLWDRIGDPRVAARLRHQRDEYLRLCGLDQVILVPEGHARALSSRESEIAELAAAGMSNREISETLVLSVRTVETHLLRIYQKLGIRRRDDLAHAVRNAVRAQAEDL